MMRRIGFAVAVIAVLIAISLFYQSAAVSSRSGSDVAAYSVERYDPYGTAALRDLLALRGVETKALNLPSLEATAHGVLIQVLPARPSAPGNKSPHVLTQQIFDWIAQGNTVIQFTRTPTDLMTRLKIAPSTQPAPGDITKIEKFEAEGGLPDLAPATVFRAPIQIPLPGQSSSAATRPLLIWSPMIIAESTNPGWKPIARVALKGDNVVAGEFPIGKGKLIIVGAPTPILNQTLNQDGDLDFLLAEIGSGPVIFDEWSHGIGHEATVIGFIHEAGLFPLLLQIGFLAMLYMWSTRSAGHPDAPPVARQRSSIEQIQTLGFLYSRSFNPDVTFTRVNAEVQRRLAEALRCQPREITTRVKTLKPDLRAKFDDIITRLANIRPEHGPRCQSCGYELHLLQSDRCPECGAPVSAHLRQQIDAAANDAPPSGQPRGHRADAAFADVLTLSHQLTREVQRDRSAL